MTAGTPTEPEQPQAAPLDEPLANEDDLDRALNDWPPTV